MIIFILFAGCVVAYLGIGSTLAHASAGNAEEEVTILIFWPFFLALVCIVGLLYAGYAIRDGAIQKLFSSIAIGSKSIYKSFLKEIRK